MQYEKLILFTVYAVRETDNFVFLFFALQTILKNHHLTKNKNK